MIKRRVVPLDMAIISCAELDNAEEHLGKELCWSTRDRGVGVPCGSQLDDSPKWNSICFRSASIAFLHGPSSMLYND